MKHKVIVGCILVSILLLFANLLGQVSDGIYTWMEHYMSSADLQAGQYRAYYLEIDDANTLLCAYAQSEELFYFDFYIFDELRFYKWKSNEQETGLVAKYNVNGICFLFLEVTKPGKYYLVMKSNASVMSQNVEFFFTTAPNGFSINKSSGFKSAHNSWIREMGSYGGYIQLVVNSSYSQRLITYLNTTKKTISIRTNKSINVLVNDFEGTTVSSYHGIKGRKKINIGLTNSVLVISSDSPSDAFVTLELPE